MARMIYRRTHELVAVRHFRLDSQRTLTPGDPLPALREFHRRSLYQRHLVGAKNCPWTAAQLARHAARVEREELAQLEAEISAEEKAKLEAEAALEAEQLAAFEAAQREEVEKALAERPVSDAQRAAFESMAEAHGVDTTNSDPGDEANGG